MHGDAQRSCVSATHPQHKTNTVLIIAIFLFSHPAKLVLIMTRGLNQLKSNYCALNLKE